MIFWKLRFDRGKTIGQYSTVGNRSSSRNTATTVCARQRFRAQRKLSIERLEEEIGALNANKQLLQDELHTIEQKINDATARDYNAEILQRTLQDFRTSFTGLNPTEQFEALQLVLKNVVVHPQKLALEVFELEEFLPGLQNRKDWLPGLDSN